MIKPKVLLVNDHPASLMALESVLVRKHEETDYDVVTAQSGEEALRYVLQQQFAVILLDVSMPGMDGFETAQIIHSHPRSASVPIIFVTAHYADEMHRLKGYQKGAVDYLFTPIIPQILQNKVAVFVDLAKKNLQLQQQAEELAELNRDLQVQRMKELKQVNAALQAEIVERRQAEERAHGLATRDPLTGLYNRRFMEDSLQRFVRLADREQREISLLMIDLDHFKRLNDEHGHAFGDQVLRETATTLLGALRETDIVCRYGGEELVVILPDCPIERAADKAEFLRLRIQELSNAHGADISASFGVASLPHTSQSVTDLLSAADAALYRAKQGGRNQVMMAPLRAYRLDRQDEETAQIEEFPRAAAE